MSALQLKVNSLLKHIKSIEDKNSPERKDAIKLLAKTLHGKKIYILKKKDGDPDVANDVIETIQAARQRLEHIHSQLDIAVKTNMGGNTIH